MSPDPLRWAVAHGTVMHSLGPLVFVSSLSLSPNVAIHYRKLSQITEILNALVDPGVGAASMRGQKRAHT